MTIETQPTPTTAKWIQFIYEGKEHRRQYTNTPCGGEGREWDAAVIEGFIEYDFTPTTPVTLMLSERGLRWAQENAREKDGEI
jgi:hypothetical protein